MRTFLLTGLLWAVAGTALAQMKGGDEMTGPYNVVEGWPADVCGDGWQQGSTGGVWAESVDPGNAVSGTVTSVSSMSSGIDSRPTPIV